METYESRHRRSRGFTLIEAMVAAFVLAVGLLAGAALISEMLRSTDRSRYMAAAAVLASEKLEDLSRWPAGDPHVAVAGGAAAGSLTADVTATVATGGGNVTVNYFDEIAISLDTGAFSVTVSGRDAGGGVTYTTTTHAPDGTVTTTTGADPPEQVSFRRRWLIEGDQPVAGVRRVTVRVEMAGQTVRPPVEFEMSMVRP